MNQYYCTNPTWHYSTSLSTAPLPGVLDPSKPILFLIHCGGSSSTAQQRQFHDERFKSTFNMVAMDAAFHGWTTGARREGRYTIEDAADNFLAAIDKLYGPERVAFSILGEGHFGANCATWMAVSAGVGECDGWGAGAVAQLGTRAHKYPIPHHLTEKATRSSASDCSRFTVRNARVSPPVALFAVPDWPSHATRLCNAARCMSVTRVIARMADSPLASQNAGKVRGDEGVGRPVPQQQERQRRQDGLATSRGPHFHQSVPSRLDLAPLTHPSARLTC